MKRWPSTQNWLFPKPDSSIHLCFYLSFGHLCNLSFSSCSLHMTKCFLLIKLALDRKDKTYLQQDQMVLWSLAQSRTKDCRQSRPYLEWTHSFYQLQLIEPFWYKYRIVSFNWTIHLSLIVITRLLNATFFPLSNQVLKFSSSSFLFSFPQKISSVYTSSHSRKHTHMFV